MLYYKIINRELYIYLPKKMKFDLKFHRLMASIISLVLKYKNSNRIIFSCDINISYDKMCKTYIFNVLDFFKSKGMHIYTTRKLKEDIVDLVHKKSGKTYGSEINVMELLLKENVKYYSFKGIEEIYKPIGDIVKTITDLSLIYNDNELRDFLTTTIGEIFSNSLNHSEQDEVFFLFNVEKEKDDFYLYVSIIDYGTTIISNVRGFLKDTNKTSSSCMSWAIKRGHTTREGSGGYGLDMLINYIKIVKGMLLIFSGNAYYSLEPNGKIRIEENQNELFCGTSVTFKIKLFDTDNVISYQNGIIDCFSLDDLA